MHNREASSILSNCSEELDNISLLLTGLGDEANPTPYINKYAVIRATGAIEICFKTIIADKVDEGSHEQVKNFIKKKIRLSSCNPKLDAIKKMLCEFDSNWGSKFDELVSLEDKPRLKGALTKLVDARNEFAHGGNPVIKIIETIDWYEEGVTVLEILDKVVNMDFEQE